jgi:tagatose-1,6-bisphosphate aldolase non-catalytic subunit AgaZ/GatZ
MVENTDTPRLGRSHALVRILKREDVPVVKALVRTLKTHFERESCLLAICPNSRAVTRAALLAAQEANAPLLLTSTLNQVDRDGGYTGWTHDALVDFLQQEAERLEVDVPILPCLDHGGPWLKDRHTMQGYSFEETMGAVKRSLESCIDAGYELLHIDPTVDRRTPAGAPVSIDWVVENTLDLIEHAEQYRRDEGRPPISYEVGTEEVHGGLADLDTFDRFLEQLDAGLHERGLDDAWPCFVVGKVGTDLDTSYFEPDTARDLTRRTKPFGALVKGHYTDYVDNPEDYPLAGMGGANVGPEFTEEEYEALMDLVALERKIGADSGLPEALRSAVVESGRWTKWLHDDEEGRAFEDLNEDRRAWLVRTGSRYVWTDPDVRAARDRLYNNLDGHREADAFVLWRIKQAMMKYYHAFNLIDFNARLERVLRSTKQLA